MSRTDLGIFRDHCRQQATTGQAALDAPVADIELNDPWVATEAQQARDARRREVELWKSLADQVDDYLAGRLGSHSAAHNPADDHDPLFGPTPTEPS